MGKLDGKVAVVTGAARGLGRAYAKRLAGLGAKVAVSDINLHSYEEFAAEKDDMTGDSTVAEIIAAGGYAHYGAAKAAIAHYTRYLAQDLGPFGITANCIAPGVIATGRIMQMVIPGSSQSNRDRTEAIALRRLGTVEDCARVVEFLTTDLSDYVTGAVIPIDGGVVRG
jgi:NAD(P)-dependent dehydrogenase (short-subunit alcohol dehydrogenase family)